MPLSLACALALVLPRTAYARAGSVRRIAREGLGGIGIDGGIADREIIERAMLVRCPCVVSHLHDPIEEFRCCRCKLFGGSFFRFWNRLDERIPVKRIDLIKGYHWDHQSIAQLRRRDRASGANDHVEVHRRRIRT